MALLSCKLKRLDASIDYLKIAKTKVKNFCPISPGNVYEVSFDCKKWLFEERELNYVSLPIVEEGVVQ